MARVAGRLKAFKDIEMPFCTECGATLIDTDRFCGECDQQRKRTEPAEEQIEAHASTAEPPVPSAREAVSQPAAPTPVSEPRSESCPNCGRPNRNSPPPDVRAWVLLGLIVTCSRTKRGQYPAGTRVPVFRCAALSRFSPKISTFVAYSCCLVLASAEEFVGKWWASYRRLSGKRRAARGRAP